MVDDTRGAGVGEHVYELGFDIPIAAVEGRDAGAVGADHRLDVFVAVEQVEGQVVLSGFMVLQFAALALASHPDGGQVVGNPVGADVDLCGRCGDVPAR